MIRLKIDNSEIEVNEGSTILEAARKAGIRIPSMCYLKGYDNHPSCMVCLVKDLKTGNLVPSCAMKVKEGMEISAGSEEVLEARKQALELLLSDHVGDCEAPCSLACPAYMNIPLMNRLIGEERFTEALTVVKEQIALPYILGYICPAPCEKVCRRKNVDDAVSICLLKRFSAEAGTDVNAEALKKGISERNSFSGKNVAVIGSGPAGLAAAYYLRLYGHGCDVFEKSPEPGGTLRYSIPDEELPKNVIDQEVDLIRSMGVSFHFSTLINREVFETEIKNKYQAVVVATGNIETANHLGELIETGKTGYAVNDKDMSSSVPGIYVCGSAVKPHKMAVRSVAEGKDAADAVHHYLNKRRFEIPEKMFNSRIDKMMPEEYDEYLKESIHTGKVWPKAGIINGFSVEEAVLEAKRCMHCDCRKLENCKLRIYADEYKIDRKKYAVGSRKALTKQIQHDQVIYEPEKCIRCGICIEVSADGGEKYGLAFQGRGFDVRVTTPLGIPFNEGLSQTAVSCALSCPTGALSLRHDDKNKFHKVATGEDTE